MTSRRLTVQEAAQVLGSSVDAVRMRVPRGTLESENDSDGRVYVRVDGDSSETKPRLDSEFTALISARDELIVTLREQLAQAYERDRENRMIIAALTSRIPAIEAPSGAEESSETPAPESDASGPTDEQDRFRVERRDATHIGEQSRSWWRRWFYSPTSE